MRKSVSGFTIVELLIVIVVIAILATISVVAYNGIQNRAYDSSVQSDLKALATKLELFKAGSASSTYPDPGLLNTDVLNFRATKNAYRITGLGQNLSYCYATDNASYVVVALSKAGTFFYISNITTAPKISTAAWNTTSNPNLSCSNAEPTVTTSNNLRGFAPEDTTTGPWRAWTGGN